MTEISSDTIINYLEDSVKQKLPIPPATWLDASQKLLVLIGADQDFLFDLQQQVAQAKVKEIESGKSVAQAKAISEATDEYKKFCKQKAKIERIYEFIRVAKLQARLSNEEYNSGNLY